MTRLLNTLARFKSHLPLRLRAGRLPPLLVLSDERRGFTLEHQLKAWPRGTAFIERTFGDQALHAGDPHRHTLRLATCTPHQARHAKLDGIHWPQNRLRRRLASKTTGLIETTSAHTGLALAKAARQDMDAILVSTAFRSDSPSATRPLGPIRIANLQRMFPNARIYALGGINPTTTRRLLGTGICGVALVTYGMTS